jgi:flagellar hook-basal body complex protein FliE
VKVFYNGAYINPSGAKNYAVEMVRTHPDHMLPPNSPYFGSGNKVIALEEKISPDYVSKARTFEHAMLQALDKVSGAQLNVSELEKEAIINPDSVDIHDITIAQAEANMALGITRNILSRLVQGWRDIINTR